MNNFETIRFSEAYDLANFVWKHLTEWSEPEEFDSFLDPQDTEVTVRLARPQRDTLLHLFLRRLYEKAYLDEFEHNRNDMLDLVILEYETILQFNDVLYEKTKLSDELSDDYDSLALERVALLRAQLPVDRIAQDTFQLLFRDRMLLLRFNRLAARAVGHLAPDGRVARANLPTWLKRGVFYRDNGRCVKCGKDLTGSVVTGDAVHYDHILPLAAHGSNDPTNFQTLCADCNLQKAASEGTSERYPVFWSVE